MIKVLVSERISSSESEPVQAGCVKQNYHGLSRKRHMSSRGRTVWEIGVEGHKFGKIVSVQVKQNFIYIHTHSFYLGSCFSSCGFQKNCFF